MAFNPEQTNAKNIENTHVANNLIGAFGVLWKPSNTAIDVAAMSGFETNFVNLTQAVIVALSAEDMAIGAQIAAFKLVPKRVTKIMKAARSQNLSAESLAHLDTTVARLRGVRVGAKTPDNPLTPEDESAAGNSVSRRSYGGILESLALFIQQLVAESGYKPNETEYQTATLAAWLADLQTLHNAALAAKTATLTARNARDTQVYNKNDGLLPRMQWVKEYAETLDLPAGDARVKQLRKLRFTAPRHLQ